MPFTFFCSKCNKSSLETGKEDIALFFIESPYICTKCQFKKVMKSTEQTEDKRTKEELIEEIEYLSETIFSIQKQKNEWIDKYIFENKAHLATCEEAGLKIEELEGKNRELEQKLQEHRDDWAKDYVCQDSKIEKCVDMIDKLVGSIQKYSARLGELELRLNDYIESHQILHYEKECLSGKNKKF